MGAQITVQANIGAPVEKVWDLYTQPAHIKRWNHASDDWHTPSAESNLKIGGTFTYRMEAKDGSTGFDFEGTFEKVEKNKQITYTIADGRKVTVTFTDEDGATTVAVTFEAEAENSTEMQKKGWQAILDNFKRYVEE